MSIRRALIGGLSVLLLIATGLVAALAARQIRSSVVREAQARVDQDLTTSAAIYERELRMSAERLDLLLTDLALPCNSQEGSSLLDRTRERLGFAVLNCVAADGTALAGSFPPGTKRVPVEVDPVIRQALRGRVGWGTVVLGDNRLRLEGGPALAASQVIPRPENDPRGGTRNALLRWFAIPVKEAGGRVVSVVYGGAPLNHDYTFVDSFVDTLFGTDTFAGKPVGTVTFFLEDTRVATNVNDENGDRAVGTRVSDVVRVQVLEQHEMWLGRAWVVDAWYLSGYLPLSDPEGRTVGMLYVGLLEEPYNALQRRLILHLALPALLVLAIGIVAAALVVRRITRPVAELQESASRMERGHWDRPIADVSSYREIRELSAAMRRMQDAIIRRDFDLRAKNKQLGQANADLAKVNENYMETLRFVTHELKAPLANIQSLVDLVVSGYVGDVSEQTRPTLIRIQRNCEELQDMVKNYLDLSRAERGELDPRPRTFDFTAEVIRPGIAQAETLFRSRGVSLETAFPEEAVIHGDPELLRIALANYLNNAAKYGKEGGRATLEVRIEGEAIVTEVWNEGAGFDSAERESLFKKFSRLSNTNTRDKKGSGLGLYLTDRIVEIHGGETTATSEAGAWAQFSFTIPTGPLE